MRTSSLTEPGARPTTAEETDVDVRLRGVHKTYGELAAVDSLSLDVKRGELLTLLGPSGCGKSTTLNIVAGFVEPDAGEVHLGGREVSGLAPDKRDSAMVFQDYALFPHMTVEDNIGFGLRMRKVPQAEIRERVIEALNIVGLPGHGARYPRQLSGGQQQRVALARAIVVRPTVLLLDEPLSNLDLKLREQLRLEIRHLQQEVGITTIFVTHDQAEALVMSDRIAVLNAGQIEQLGTPEDIYQRPTNPFVAGFIGQSNLLRGEVVDPTGAAVTVRLDSGDLATGTADDGIAGGKSDLGGTVQLLVRPEVLRFAGPSSVDDAREAQDNTEVNVFRGTVREVVYLGSSASVVVDVPGLHRPLTVVTVDPASSPPPTSGDRVVLTAPIKECRVLPS